MLLHFQEISVALRRWWVPAVISGTGNKRPLWVKLMVSDGAEGSRRPAWSHRLALQLAFPNKETLFEQINLSLLLLWQKRLLSWSHLHFCHQSNLHFYGIINEQESHLHFHSLTAALSGASCTFTGAMSQCAQRIKHLHDCFQADCGESVIAVWTERRVFRGFQVQIEAKAAFASAAAHIKHMEAELSSRLHH